MPGRGDDDGGMDADGEVTGAGTTPVQLRLHRGPGVLYCGLAVALLSLVGLGAGSYLSSGRFLMALVTAVAGLGVTAFLTFLALAILIPVLEASATGVRGRMAWGRRVDVGWDGVGIDVEDETPLGTLRLDIDGQSLTVSHRSWLGFGDFVVLVAATPRAADRLTPAARSAVLQMLGIESPPRDRDRDPLG